MAMPLDMALATSYKPVLVCIAKVCVLMAFHYASAVVLFVTERYAVVVALLYVDQWLAQEYILNTNSCVAVLAGSLLVHELRDAGVQERLHGNAVHNALLALLAASNVLVLALGEHPSWLDAVRGVGGGGGGGGASTLPSSSSASSSSGSFACEEGEDTGVLKKLKLMHGGDSGRAAARGSLFAVLWTSSLLVLLSTCSLPVSPHDPLLNNVRVWAFVALSLTWMYTVNGRELRYCSVAPFTPCVLRFSCVLFLTPAPVAFAGVGLMAAGLCALTALPPRATAGDRDTPWGGGVGSHGSNSGGPGVVSSGHAGGAPAAAAAAVQRRPRDPSVGGSGMSCRPAPSPAGGGAAKIEGKGGGGAGGGGGGGAGAQHAQNHLYSPQPQQLHHHHHHPQQQQPPQSYQHHQGHHPMHPPLGGGTSSSSSSGTGGTSGSSSSPSADFELAAAAFAASSAAHAAPRAAAAADAADAASACASFPALVAATAFAGSGGDGGAPAAGSLLMIQEDAESTDALGVDPVGVDIDYNTLFEQTISAQAV